MTMPRHPTLLIIGHDTTDAWAFTGHKLLPQRPQARMDPRRCQQVPEAIWGHATHYDVAYQTVDTMYVKKDVAVVIITAKAADTFQKRGVAYRDMFVRDGTQLLWVEPDPLRLKPGTIDAICKDLPPIRIDPRGIGPTQAEVEPLHAEQRRLGLEPSPVVTPSDRQSIPVLKDEGWPPEFDEPKEANVSWPPPALEWPPKGDVVE